MENGKSQEKSLFLAVAFELYYFAQILFAHSRVDVAIAPNTIFHFLIKLNSFANLIIFSVCSLIVSFEVSPHRHGLPSTVIATEQQQQQHHFDMLFSALTRLEFTLGKCVCVLFLRVCVCSLKHCTAPANL